MGKTRGVHETTPEVRNRMVGMYEAGLGLREIAAAVNCSQRTVKRWLNRFDKEGTVETRERCGRKRATTAEQDEAIIQLASQTTITAAKAVLPALGLSCSVDTVRERLHKAGIHNWTPSRKHMQRIPLRTTDSAGIQQAVWRPTGTQHGKKKILQTMRNKKILNSKKKTTNKNNNKSVGENDTNTAENFTQPAEECLSTLTAKTVNDIVPHTENIFTQSIPPVLQHVSQCWPLDLVQNNNEMSQRPVSSYREIVNNSNPQEMPLENNEQYRNKSSKDKNCVQFAETIDNNQYMLNCQNAPIESDSRMKYYSAESDERSAIDNDMSSSMSSNSEMPETSNKRERKCKKGGKMKGTLETTIEIRNRMIGMSEAGLSTLSIALAINRSERTVKRWLERWHKEGNVQTKERKGRKRITTKEQDDAIIAMATQQPLTAAKHVAPALGLKCSVDTIRERLHKAGIHSWKLGKKQGDGNAVHTIHLWQPSGNRPNKIKSTNERKRKLVRKKQNVLDETNKSDHKEKKNASENYATNKLTNCESQKIVPETNSELPLNSYNTAPPTTTHSIDSMSMSNSTLIETQVPQQLAPQNVQEPHMTMLGPSQGESACRLMCSNVQSTMPCHGTTNSSLPIYSSNAAVINSHSTVHMEHSDTINYEPYIWTF